MEPFATPGDIEAIWRPLTDAEQGIAVARIESASRLVRRKVREATGGSLDDMITAETLTFDDVKDVVVEMVLRTFQLSGYVRQGSVAVDDASKSNTIDSSVSGKGGIYLLDYELDSLIGSAVTVSGGAFEIALG